MNQPNDHSTDDTLLIAAAALAGALIAASCLVWLAAQLVMLVIEQRLLVHASGSVLDVATGLVRHPSEPAKAFAPADTKHLPGGVWLYVLAAPLLGGTFMAALAAWQFVSDRLPMIGSGRRDERDSRWARPRDLAALTVRPKHAAGRLVLGKAGRQLIALTGNHSVVVFGPTDSGKTTALVVPALLEHTGAAFVLSTKSDVLRHTIVQRRRSGPVWVYDPLELTGHTHASWTPLRACREWPAAKRMAAALTSAVGDTHDHDGRFWDAMASKMLEALLHAAALDNRTMRDVVRWVDTQEETEVATILRTHNAEAALQSWTASQSREPRTLSNVYASTEMMLRAYSTPGMADCHIEDSFNPEQLLNENGTLFVCAPVEDQAVLRPVFAALFADVYRAAVLRSERTGKPLAPSLLLVLDEAANIAPIRDLAEIASTCRAYGIQLVTVFQDLAQVEARYGQRARTVINNHTAKLVLPGQSDRELLDLLTRLLGEEAVDQITRSHNPHGVTTNESIHYRPLAAIHQLRQLPKGTGILIYGNYPPTKLTLRPFYDDPTLRHLADPHAA